MLLAVFILQIFFFVCSLNIYYTVFTIKLFHLTHHLQFTFTLQIQIQLINSIVLKL